MAFLRESTTRHTIPLEPEHSVGRAPTCSLRIEDRCVSAQHAMIRHGRDGWVVRDLASSNGTWIDGRRVPPGVDLRVSKGSRLAFGVAEAVWELVDDAAPEVMAVPLDGGPPVVAEGDLLALPSPDDPAATIYRGLGDSWFLEAGDAEAVPIANLQVLRCAGRAFRFCSPSDIRATTRSRGAVVTRVRDLAFQLSVSLDEEHVRVRARGTELMIDLGERAHHYLLLTLARARVADQDTGIPETSCGWVDIESLCTDASTTRGRVGVDVFRIRKQLASSGVVDAASLVERRPGQLRIGTGNLQIERR